MRLARSRLAVGLALLQLSRALPAAPADSFWTRLQVHGFASASAIHTSYNRWFGHSQTASFDFTELGVNASLRLTPGLLIAGQVLSRRAGDMYDGMPALDYGLIDWTALHNPDWRLGLRLGRLKNPLGLYNETRDMPFTRPGIFMPQVVYFDRVRNLVLSTDGAMLYGEHNNPLGQVSLTLGFGQPVTDTNVEWAFLNRDFPGRLSPNTNTWLARLWYASNNERWQFGVSLAALGFGYAPNRQAPLTLGAGSLDLSYTALSAQYNAERWSLSAEYVVEPVRWRNFGPLQPDHHATTDAGYVAATWRLRPNLELMLRAERAAADRRDRSGNRTEQQTGGLVPVNALFNRSLTAGLRWDLAPNWMLRTEYSYQDGTFILSNRENPDLAERARYWNLFAVLLAVRF